MMMRLYAYCVILEKDGNSFSAFGILRATGKGKARDQAAKNALGEAPEVGMRVAAVRLKEVGDKVRNWLRGGLIELDQCERDSA